MSDTGNEGLVGSEAKNYVPPEAFDDDYLYFYSTRLTDQSSDREAELIWRLLGLTPDHAVLDVPCGHGRIANRLAQRGCRVLGVDVNEILLERARSDAARRGLTVHYERGDMRELGFDSRFDIAINWYSSFGYFDDDGNQMVLAGIYNSLRPQGLLVLDVLSRDYAAQRIPVGEEGFVQVIDRDGDFLVDRLRLDAVEGRLEFDRSMVRSGTVRRLRMSLRVPTFTELRDWLSRAGFASVTAYDVRGEPYSIRSPRMLVVAQR